MPAGRPQVPDRAKETTGMVLLGRGGRELGECLVGLPGLEPGTSSLSEMDGQALCYPAFPQLALIHEWHRDGVSHSSGSPCRRWLVGASGRAIGTVDRSQATYVHAMTVGDPEPPAGSGAPARGRGSAIPAEVWSSYRRLRGRMPLAIGQPSRSRDHLSRPASAGKESTRVVHPIPVPFMDQRELRKGRIAQRSAVHL